MIIDVIPVRRVRSLLIKRVDSVTPKNIPADSEMVIIIDIRSNSAHIAATV